MPILHVIIEVIVIIIIFLKQGPHLFDFQKAEVGEE